MSAAKKPGAEEIAHAVKVATRPGPSTLRFGGGALREARARHVELKRAAEDRLASWGLDANGQPVKAVAS